MFLFSVKANCEPTPNVDRFLEPTLGVLSMSIPENGEAADRLASAATSEIANRFPAKKGVVIVGVYPGSPADRAGIRSGDMILQFNGKAVTSDEQLTKLIRSNAMGIPIKVVIRYAERSGVKFKWSRRALSVRLATYSDIINALVVTEQDELTKSKVTRCVDTDTDLGPTRVTVHLFSKGDILAPILQVMYHDDDWLFIKTYSFLIDGKTYKLDADDVKREVKNGVYEWSQHVGDSDNKSDPVMKILNALHFAKSAKVFMHGDTYRGEHELTGAELLELRIILEHFEFASSLNR